MNSEIQHIHVAKLQLKTFSVGRGITLPANSLLVVTKAGSGCCKLPLRDTKEEEEDEEVQEGNASLAAGSEIRLDVVVARQFYQNCVAFSYQKKNKDQH